MHRSARTPASLFALVFGLVYVVVGVYGFSMTGFDSFADHHGPRLLGLFMVNGLHNTAHLLIGAAWLVASPRHRAARLVNLVVGIAFGLLTILGFADLVGFLGIHSLGDPDNFLHLGTAVLSLYFGSIGAERLSSDSVTPHRTEV